jgi:hypothetical protein
MSRTAAKQPRTLQVSSSRAFHVFLLVCLCGVQTTLKV